MSAFEQMEREEFLQRLDLRISVISAFLATHEKYCCRDLPPKNFKEAQKAIDKINYDLMEQMREIDEKIVKHYDEYREEYRTSKENEQ